jgi:hypothetical protein
MHISGAMYISVVSWGFGGEVVSARIDAKRTKNGN